MGSGSFPIPKLRILRELLWNSVFLYAFLCLHFKFALESTPQICRTEGCAWSQSSRTCPSMVWKQSVQSLEGGTGGVSRKQARGNRQVLMLWGCLQEGWRGREWDGTGHDGEGQRAWAHHTLNVCLRGPQTEESIGG